MIKFLTILEWVLASVFSITGIFLIIVMGWFGAFWAVCFWFPFSVITVVLFEKWKRKISEKQFERRNYRK